MSRTIEETVDVGEAYGEWLYAEVSYDVTNESVSILSVFWKEETARPNGLPKLIQRHDVQMGSRWIELTEEVLANETDWSAKSRQWVQTGE